MNLNFQSPGQQQPKYRAPEGKPIGMIASREDTNSNPLHQPSPFSHIMRSNDNNDPSLGQSLGRLPTNSVERQDRKQTVSPSTEGQNKRPTHKKKKKSVSLLKRNFTKDGRNAEKNMELLATATPTDGFPMKQGYNPAQPLNMQ